MSRVVVARFDSLNLSGPRLFLPLVSPPLLGKPVVHDDAAGHGHVVGRVPLARERDHRVARLQDLLRQAGVLGAEDVDWIPEGRVRVIQEGTRSLADWWQI
jgi:hypothetical protein